MAELMKILATVFALAWLIAMASFVLDHVIDDELLDKIRAVCMTLVFTLAGFFLVVIVWAK